MRWLVTGASGFIGQNLVQYLTEECKDTVIECDDVPDDSFSWSGINAIVHLAAISGIPACETNPREAVAVNVGQTLELLEKMRWCEALPPVILASSRAVMSGYPARHIVNEGMMPRPASVYGATKVAMESLGLAYFAAYGVPVTILRFANVYGPYSMHKNSVVAEFMKAVLMGKPLPVHGDGNQRRDFIYARDICRAIVGIARGVTAGEQAGHVLTLSGTNCTVLSLAQMVCEVAKAPFTVEHHFDRLEEPEIIHSDTKVRAVLDWEPYRTITPLRNGLELTYSWFKEQYENPDSWNRWLLGVAPGPAPEGDGAHGNGHR